MCQWHEPFLLPTGHPVDVLAYQGVAATVTVFVMQPFADAHRRMALLHMDLLIGFQNGIDDGNERGQCRRNRGRRSPITGRCGELAHLPDGIAMDAEVARNGALALVLDHHDATYFDV